MPKAVFRRLPFFIISLIVLLVILFNTNLEFPYVQYMLRGKTYISSESDLFSAFSKCQMKQNDSSIVKYVKDHYINPPSKEEYNLTDSKKGDPSFTELIMKILDNKRNGFFIECGANDGEFLSTTLSLERKFDWTGLLVEADPHTFKKLKSKNRKAWTSNVCLSITERVEKMTFFHHKTSSGLGMLKGSRRSKPHQRINGLPEIGKQLDTKLWEEMEITCIPIFSLLTALKVTTVDMFSLDVEGAELKILRTIPFDEVFIKIFNIEYNIVPELELREFMAEKNYAFVKNITAGFTRDYLFVHNSIYKQGIY